MPVMDGIEATKRYREYEKANHYQNTKFLSAQTRKSLVSGLKNGNSVTALSNGFNLPSSAFDSPGGNSYDMDDGNVNKIGLLSNNSKEISPLLEIQPGSLSHSGSPSIINSGVPSVGHSEKSNNAGVMGLRSSVHTGVPHLSLSNIIGGAESSRSSQIHKEQLRQGLQSIIIDDIPINERLPIIGMSANSDTVQKTQAIDAGMSIFLPKPFTANELFLAINSAYSMQMKSTLVETKS